MSNPNIVLIKYYLKLLLKALDEKQKAKEAAKQAKEARKGKTPR
jgi:hypothetical protein